MASRVRFSSRTISRLNEDAALKALNLLTIFFQKRLRKRLNKAGTGRLYPLNTVRSSTKDEAPAPQTGRLRDSWATGRREKIRMPDGVSIKLRQANGFGQAVKYARALEFGYAPNNLAPRRYIKKTIDSFRGRRGTGIFERFYRDEIRKINRSGPHG
tara:strand:- start:138 stop:608 length:471 start_codon:yes stop_codon:yes gene_type:complete